MNKNNDPENTSSYLLDADLRTEDGFMIGDLVYINALGEAVIIK